MFSLKVKLGVDVFEVEGMPIEQFGAVVLMLDRWYRERGRCKPVIHGDLVFEAPIEQPIP